MGTGGDRAGDGGTGDPCGDGAAAADAALGAGRHGTAPGRGSPARRLVLALAKASQASWRAWS